MKSVVPPKYHQLIIPKYRTYSPLCTHKWSLRHYAAMGCRLVLRDLGYLQSLNRPNVRLTFDHIAHVEPHGIVTETGMECRSYS
jgi:hypothetical protein